MQYRNDPGASFARDPRRSTYYTEMCTLDLYHYG